MLHADLGPQLPNPRGDRRHRKRGPRGAAEHGPRPRHLPRQDRPALRPRPRPYLPGVLRRSDALGERGLRDAECRAGRGEAEAGGAVRRAEGRTAAAKTARGGHRGTGGSAGGCVSVGGKHECAEMVCSHEWIYLLNHIVNSKNVNWRMVMTGRGSFYGDCVCEQVRISDA